MYDNETKNHFIELRAQGLSLDAISAQLSVPKTTLGRWHLESLEQIQHLRALQWHLLEDQIGQRLEDTLTHIAQRIRKWDAKLDKQLGNYQKPGDSIRVIRESRREYLQLRALLLAPLQPARRNAPCLMSTGSEKWDKTGRNPDSLNTTPLPPNDLQQPETSMSHSANSPLVESSSVEPATPDLNLDPAPALALDPAPDSSFASLRLCGESPDVITDTPPLINTPLQRGEPAQPPAIPLSVAESSDAIAASNGSFALPLPRAADAPASRRATLPALGQGEGQTGKAPQAASRYVGIGENDDPKLGQGEGLNGPTATNEPSTQDGNDLGLDVIFSHRAPVLATLSRVENSSPLRHD